MNCRDIELLLLTERDGVLTADQRAALERHVANCPVCQQMSVRLAEAMTAFQVETTSVVTPDIEQEWQALRGRLHDQPAAPAKRRLAPVVWLGAPLAAAAALALAYFGLKPRPQPESRTTISPIAATAPTAEVAQAEYVEAGDANASTLVYVDKESGWLVVWAVDADAKGSG